jgi:hypothetical protein
VVAGEVNSYADLIEGEMDGIVDVGVVVAVGEEGEGYVAMAVWGVHDAVVPLGNGLNSFPMKYSFARIVGLESKGS